MLKSFDQPVLNVGFSGCAWRAGWPCVNLVCEPVNELERYLTNQICGTRHAAMHKGALRFVGGDAESAASYERCIWSLPLMFAAAQVT